MAPNWGFDEETVPEDIDEMAMLAAALEEEKSRRRRKGNNRAGSPIANEPNNVDIQITDAETSTTTTTTPVAVEKETAKTKREKRKEKKKLKEENTSLENGCNVCGDQFETRNQLFSHIDETGHALAIPQAGSKAGSKAGKKGNKRR